MKISESGFMIKKFRHELIILSIIVILSIVIGSVNSQFYSVSNIYNLLKSTVVMGLFALGSFLVLVSGDIDISFTAIGAFCMYVTSKIVLLLIPGAGILVIMLVASLMGVLLGFINAVFISLLKMPGLIVTLGTGSMIRGFMLTFIGVRIINRLPDSMVAFSKVTFLNHTQESGHVLGLSIGFFIFIAFAILIHAVLKYTVTGRAVYALGGDRVATARVGFNITKIQFFIYGTVGFLSGLAGIVHSSFMRNVIPFDLVGTELTVIAAVVLGGTSITGGKGSVIGAVLGVFLLVLINNSLIMVGIPSYWQRAVVGTIILLSTGSVALQERRSQGA